LESDRPSLRRSRPTLALHPRDHCSPDATGLVHALRDQHPPAGRRFLILSEEFASVLHALKKGNGHLSPLLRCAWDSGHLATPIAGLDTHQHPQATATHISLIAHITQRELADNLHRTEAHNGFANRCLWAWVERSNCLPEGGNLGAHELTPIARELRRALDWAAATPEILSAAMPRRANSGRIATPP
jgi:hypothetical protein